MATLREIRFRIGGVRSIEQITKAMKMVAASRLRRAQERILLARPYARKMREVLSRLVCHTDPGSHPLLTPRDTGRSLLMVITSDKGLCGSFNHNLLRQAWGFATRTGTKGRGLEWVVVGRKGREFLQARGVVPRKEYLHLFSSLSYGQASQIRQDLMGLYDELEVDEIVLLFNEFKSAGQQRIAWEKLLPIDPDTSNSCPIPVDYQYEPSPLSVLHDLLPKYLEVQIYHALLESAAAEQAARMAAMEMASKNAGEMIDRMTLSYNRIRQERITKELLEVVAGAEALRSEG